MNTKTILSSTLILSFSFLFLFSATYCFGSEINDRHPGIRFKIDKSISLFKQARYNEALPYLEDVIYEGSTNPDIHYIVGEIYYAKNELNKAIKHWEIAQGNSPKEALRLKIEKARKELKLDKKHRDKISCNFVLKYNQNDTYASDLILHSLVNSYNQLAYDFGWYKNSEFTVILYSNEDFTDILDFPSWAAAIYDGKIRMPFQYASFNLEKLESIIRHELTHALLHRICGNNVPAWFHEGIAQYEDGIDDSTTREILREAVINSNLMSINDLGTDFGRFKDDAKVKLAYAESLDFVEYLIDNYGFYTILDIINNFNTHSHLDELLASVYGFDLNQLEDSWKEHLRLLYL
ncbi:MAG: peptidase MA family metallohydrolase [Candidatus Scalinduaceae bacterium]